MLARQNHAVQEAGAKLFCGQKLLFGSKAKAYVHYCCNDLCHNRHGVTAYSIKCRDGQAHRRLSGHLNLNPRHCQAVSMTIQRVALNTGTMLQVRVSHRLSCAIQLLSSMFHLASSGQVLDTKSVMSRTNTDVASMHDLRHSQICFCLSHST